MPLAGKPKRGPVELSRRVRHRSLASSRILQQAEAVAYGKEEEESLGPTLIISCPRMSASSHALEKENGPPGWPYLSTELFQPTIISSDLA